MEPISEKFFEFARKTFWLINFSTAGQIRLILVPLDQKLAELTSRKENYSKKPARKFFEIVFSKLHKSGGVHPSRFINFSEKTLRPLPKGNSG